MRENCWLLILNLFADHGSFWAPVAPNSKRSLWGPLVNFEHLHDCSSKYNAKRARIPEAARIAIAGKKAPQAQIILASQPYGIHMNIRTVRRLLADIGCKTNDNYCIRWAQFPDAMLKTVALNIHSFHAIDEDDNGRFLRAIYIHYGASKVLCAVGQDVFGIDGAHHSPELNKLHQLTLTGMTFVLTLF